MGGNRSQQEALTLLCNVAGKDFHVHLTIEMAEYLVAMYLSSRGAMLCNAKPRRYIGSDDTISRENFAGATSLHTPLHDAPQVDFAGTDDLIEAKEELLDEKTRHAATMEVLSHTEDRLRESNKANEKHSLENYKLRRELVDAAAKEILQSHALSIAKRILMENGWNSTTEVIKIIDKAIGDK